MEDDGYRINVSFPDDMPNFGILIIMQKNNTVKELQGAITKKVRKLFKRAFKCTYVTNGNGSVLDPEFTLFSSLQKEDSVEAFAIKLKNAQDGTRKRPIAQVDAADGETSVAAAAPVQEGKGKKKRRKKDPNAPKRPMSSYLLFQESKRPEMVAKGFKGKEILQEVGNLWKAMSEAEKQPWVDKQASLNTDYQAAMKSYNEAKGSAPNDVPPPPPVMGDDSKKKSKKDKFDYKLFKRVGTNHKDTKAKGLMKAILADYNTEKDDSKEAEWLREKIKTDKMVEWIKATFNKEQQTALLG